MLSSKTEIQGPGHGGEGEEGQQDCFPATVLEHQLPKADHGNPAAKTSNNHQPYLDVPLQSAFARSSDTLSDLSTYSADNENERRAGRLHTLSSTGRLLSRSPAPPSKTWKERLWQFWARNKGLALVVLAQLFGVMMNVTIRLLEMSGTSGPGMHPFQVRSAVPLIFPPATLGWSLTTIDSVRSDDGDSFPQQHLPVFGKGSRSAFWIAGSSRAPDCTWDRWLFRR